MGSYEVVGRGLALMTWAALVQRKSMHNKASQGDAKRQRACWRRYAQTGMARHPKESNRVVVDFSSTLDQTNIKRSYLWN